jgi:CRP-like cAMP-binding protein
VNPNLEQAQPTPSAATAGPQRFRHGELVYAAGAPGVAWRVISGSVRLDRPGPDGPMFASLAVPGDVIGAETLMFGAYAFEARALSDCELALWSDGSAKPSGEFLVQMLAATEHRAADVIALRCGQALQRVRRLMLMLTRGSAQEERTASIEMPSLRDMADITDLTAETVSRAISALRKEGVLARKGYRHAALERERLLPAAGEA